MQICKNAKITKKRSLATLVKAMESQWVPTYTKNTNTQIRKNHNNNKRGPSPSSRQWSHSGCKHTFKKCKSTKITKTNRSLATFVKAIESQVHTHTHTKSAKTHKKKVKSSATLVKAMESQWVPRLSSS